MPIVKPVIADDPFGPLAWNASVAIVALEKISAEEAISPEERGSMVKVAAFLRFVITACRQKPEELLSSGQDVMTSSLLGSFCAIADTSSGHAEPSPIDLNKTLQDLGAVLDQLDSGSKADSALLERVQNACLVLQKNANLHRPDPDQPQHVEF